MAVNTGAFVEPSFILAGIRSDYDGIFSREVQEVGDIVGSAAIAAEMAAHIAVVDPNLAIAEDAIKLQDESLSGVGPIDGKSLAVPSDTILREEAAHGMIAMRVQVSVVYVFEREGYHPVMGKLYSCLLYTSPS